jgi:hypothetical protein
VRYVDRIFAAEQQRELELLLTDLRVVCWPEYDGDRTVQYTAKQLGLFDDRVLPPELEVVRLVRQLAEKSRLSIDRDERGGKCLTVRLRSGRVLQIELLASRDRR